MRFLRLTLLVLATALAAACTDREDPTAPGRRSPPDESEKSLYARYDMVYAQGGQFMLNGRPYRHVGANMVQLLYMTEDQIRGELAFARDAGIRQIRVFLANDAWPQDQIVNRLRWVADRAYYDYGGIRLTVVVSNFFADNVGGSVYAQCRRMSCTWENPPPNFAAAGDFRYYTEGCMGSLCTLNRDWVRGGYQGAYRDLALAAAGALRDHPGIFSWQMSNELRVHNPDESLRQALLDFYHNMANAIKSVDPNHMVSTGAVGSFDTFGRVGNWEGWADRLNNHPNIDYVTVHEYLGPDPHNGLEKENDDGQKVEIYYANTRWRKPVVIEEFAFRAGLTARGAAYYSRYLAAPRPDSLVDAILYWGVTANQSWQTGDGYWSPIPAVHGSIAPGWFVDQWRRWADFTGAMNTVETGTARLVTRLNGRCLDAPSNANGTRLHMWDCMSGNPNQVFELTAANELKVHGKCVGADTGHGNNGNAIVLWTCDGGGDKRWALLPDGKLMGINGRCIDIYNGSQELGAQLVLWDCHGGANQQWTRQAPGGATTAALVSLMHGRCINAPGSANGTRVQMADCVPGSGNQQWSYSAQSGEMRIFGGKCLDAWTARRLDPIVVHDCWGGTNQKWDITGDGHLQLRGIRDEAGRPMCVDITNANRGLGAEMVLQYCHRADNQLWRRSPDGTGGGTVSVTSDLNGLCLDAPSATTGTRLHMWDCLGSAHPNQRFIRTVAAELRVLGKCVDGDTGVQNSPVRLVDCNNGPHQKWYFTEAGELRGSSGLCIDIGGPNPNPGATMILWPCHGKTNQTWGYREPRS